MPLSAGVDGGFPMWGCNRRLPCVECANMSDIERAASMVGCWYGDAGAEVGDLAYVESHDGRGRVRVLVLWAHGGEDSFNLRPSMLLAADMVRVA